MKNPGESPIKKVIIVVIVALMVLALVGGFFLYKGYQDKRVEEARMTGYSIGYNASIVNLARGQTQTGEILIWADNSVQVRTIKNICDAFIMQQLSNIQ